VARDPNTIRFIIIGRIITGWRIVSSVIDSRGPYPKRWRRWKKNPEMATMVSPPG
jgi:hypothetical protein